MRHKDMPITETIRDSYSFTRRLTQFYGACEYEADGSYISTRWACLGSFIPLFPLYSALIHSVEREYFLGPQTYQYTRMPGIHWPQVMRTYAFVGAVWAFVIYGSRYLTRAEVNVLLIIPLGLPLFLLPWFLQRRARKDATLE